MKPVYTTSFTNWKNDISTLFDKAELAGKIPLGKTILIKPNLVMATAPPVTVGVECVECVVEYLQENIPESKICIGEGTGAAEYETAHCFKILGYSEMAQRKKIELIDLNMEPCVKKSVPEYQRLPELFLPDLLDNVFLLSIPVLKAHSMSEVTLTMKNMMGCVPPEFYQQGGYWKKSSFHNDLHAAIFDLNRYRTADFTLLEATVGMAEAHLWGPECDPPVNRLAVSYDPVAIDSYGCTLLRKDWKDIEHIRLAHNVLGKADNLNLIDI